MSQWETSKRPYAVQVIIDDITDVIDPPDHAIVKRALEILTTKDSHYLANQLRLLASMIDDPLTK